MHKDDHRKEEHGEFDHSWMFGEEMLPFTVDSSLFDDLDDFEDPQHTNQSIDSRELHQSNNIVMIAQSVSKEILSYKVDREACK